MRGEIREFYRLNVGISVSIRSPRGCAGRSPSRKKAEAEAKFQSAPRAGARGDLTSDASGAELVGFNPLPARVRGEIATDELVFRRRDVSIRSPRGCAGR